MDHDAVTARDYVRPLSKMIALYATPRDRRLTEMCTSYPHVLEV